MPTKRIILIVAVLLGVIFLIGAFRILLPNLFTKTVLAPLPSPFNYEKSPVYAIPIRYNNPSVKYAGVNYVFDTKFKELKGNELIVNMKLPNNGKFLIDKDTKIESNRGGKVTSAKIEGLKPGQRLNINSEYKLREKVWVTRKVTIIVPTASSSASASAKPK